MRRVNRSALVPYSAAQMFNLVNDVPAYPEFLPWCVRSKILQQDDRRMMARLEIAKAGLRQSFTTSNQLVPGESIKITLVNGPFRHMSGLWTFKQLGEDACKVTMELSFDIDRGMFNRTLAGIFNLAADKMVDAFCNRAESIYSAQQLVR